MSFNHLIYTNWFVIDGAPCSGKTSLVSALSEKMGWRICPDFARLVYAEALHHGKTINDVQAQQNHYQDEIARRRLIRVANDNPGELIIHEYGIPSDIVWHEEKNVPVPQDVLLASHNVRYRQVFLLDMLPNAHDDIRHETNEERLRIHRRLWDTYQSLGYTPVRVPNFPALSKKVSIIQRMDFILQEIQRLSHAPLKPRHAEDLDKAVFS